MSIANLSPPSHISTSWAPPARRHVAPCERQPDAADELHQLIPQRLVQDAGFIRHVAATIMQTCVLHAAPPDVEYDEHCMQDLLPSAIVALLGLAPQECHAIGMSKALLALTDLQERRRVLIQMILALRVLR